MRAVAAAAYDSFVRPFFFYKKKTEVPFISTRSSADADNALDANEAVPNK